MIKKSFKHHLDEKRDTQVGIIELLFLKHRAAEEELWCFKDSIKERIKKSYLILFGALGQNGATLPPVGPLVSFKRPQQSLLLVAVLQQHPQAPLRLPLELVVEDEAERASLWPHLRTQQPGTLALGVTACIQVEVVP